MKEISTRNDDSDSADLIDARSMAHLEFEVEIDDDEIDQSREFWSHQKNLDDFFTRIYKFHRGHGFLTITLSEVFDLIQFNFIVCFTVFLVQCVNYPLLFQSDPSSYNGTHKLTVNEVFSSPKQCFPGMNLFTFCCFITAMIFSTIRLFWIINNAFNNWSIRKFYRQVLKVEPSDLTNMTWQDIQRRLISAQHTHNLCIEKENLTELDIQNRLLRFKNYEIALVNRGIIPVRLTLPLVGSIVYLTDSLMLNLRLILFEGPLAMFDSPWHLADEYKSPSLRITLANKLSKTILFYSILNFIFSPFILVWQVLNFFYGYTERIRREPGFLGSRRWSNYAKLFFRHYNELDNLIEKRLKRAYQPAKNYMNSFINYILVEIAKFLLFIAGAILAVLIVWTIYDEDTIRVEHMLTLITGLGVVVGVLQSLIPDENMELDHEELLRSVLAEVHYQPDAWHKKAHTEFVRSQFAEFFQLKYIHLIQEILSPLLTPLILYFYIRPRSLEIIDFLRQTTIHVPGIGDICTFAQLNIVKNGNRKWFAPGRPNAKETEISHQGKVELSLLHFHHTNPAWKMPKESESFVERIEQLKASDYDEKQVFQRSMSTRSISAEVNSPMVSSTQLDPRFRSTRVSRGFDQSQILQDKRCSTNEMNSSCLFLHQLHDKYKHGDYCPLDNDEE